MAEIRAELALRGANAIGVKSAVVPETFPLWLADHLRANGIELTVDKDFFDERRRVKNDAELAGMRRAQRAAEAGMDAARELLRTRVANGGLTVEESEGARWIVGLRRARHELRRLHRRPGPAGRRRATTWAPGRSQPACRS